MIRSPLHQQVDALPELVGVLVDRLTRAVDAALSSESCQRFERIFVTGCGDSHHAAVESELAFEQLAGLPCEPMTAMQFGRYAAGFLPNSGKGRNLVIAVSVSGQVSRTIESLLMAQQMGATAVALTGNGESALGQASEIVLEARMPPGPEVPAGVSVPGVRSYVASQLALYLCAIQIGRHRGHLTSAKANELRRELAGTAKLMEETIAASDPIAGRTVEVWHDADQFLFCGAGPNFGAAMFSAAKMLEASGDAAYAQDTEEWGHLQYFARHVDTPTFVISAAGWDESRALEIAEAATVIGRRVAIIAPAHSALASSPDRDVLLPVGGSLRECFSPLLTSLPGTLFAAYRAQLLGATYFQGFGGGRTPEGGGGASRIRDSVQQVRPNH